jgi:hypothetical protein
MKFEYDKEVDAGVEVLNASKVLAKKVLIQAKAI